MRKPPKNGNRVKDINTLVVDGNALFRRGFHGAKDEYNKDGEHIGGIYQFITVVRKLLQDDIYQKVFVFWDGEFSGKLRYEIYPDYKIGRGKDYINGTKPDDRDHLLETYIVQGFLDDLFIRQIRNQKGVVEGDDFIAYYCKTKEKNDKVTIVTNDRDLCQLIDEDIKIFLLDIKSYVTISNYRQFEHKDPKKVNMFNFHKDNWVLVKTICGDASDSIKGVKGIKEKTLLNYFPQMRENEVSLEQLLNQAKIIQDGRIAEKKKPIKALTNLIEGITTDITGKTEIKLGSYLYERNQALVDLSLPLIDEEGIEKFNEIKNYPLNPENRGIKEAYKKIKEFGLESKIGNSGNDYLLPFKKLIDRETKFING